MEPLINEEVISEQEPLIEVETLTEDEPVLEEEELTEEQSCLRECFQIKQDMEVAIASIHQELDVIYSFIEDASNQRIMFTYILFAMILLIIVIGTGFALHQHR